MADALRLAGVAAYDVRLSYEDSFSLAAVGDIEEAFANLIVQLRTPRTGSSTPLSPKAQQSVAIAEVVVDQLGTFANDPSARIDFLRDVLERHASLEKATRAIDAAAATVDSLLGEETRVSIAARTFLRRAAGLRAVQRNRLAAEITDPLRRADAFAALDDLYVQHLTRVLELPHTTTDSQDDIESVDQIANGQAQ